MKCDEIRQWLTCYLLKDLDKESEEEVRSHLKGCAACRAAAQKIEPTLDLLRDALAAPSKAPDKLSIQHRTRVIQGGLPTPTRKVIQWMTQKHPRLTRAAAIFVAVFCLWVLSGRIMWRIMGDMYAGLGGELPAMSESPLSGPIGPFLPLFKIGETVQDDASFTAGMPAAAPESVTHGMNIGVVSGVPAAPVPEPAQFDEVAIVKSPVVMKGIFSSRSPGAGGGAENSEETLARSEKAAELRRKRDELAEQNIELQATVQELTKERLHAGYELEDWERPAKTRGETSWHAGGTKEEGLAKSGSDLEGQVAALEKEKEFHKSRIEVQKKSIMRLREIGDKPAESPRRPAPPPASLPKPVVKKPATPADKMVTKDFDTLASFMEKTETVRQELMPSATTSGGFVGMGPGGVSRSVAGKEDAAAALADPFAVAADTKSGEVRDEGGALDLDLSGLILDDSRGSTATTRGGGVKSGEHERKNIPDLKDIPVNGRLFSDRQNQRKDSVAGDKQGKKEEGGFTGMGPGGSSASSGDIKSLFKEMGVKWPKGSYIKHVPAVSKVVVGRDHDETLAQETDRAESIIEYKEPAKSKQQQTLDKLKNIEIPEIDFRQANIRDVVAFLNSSTQEFDASSEKDDKKIDISLNMGKGSVKAEAPDETAADPFAVEPAGDAHEDAGIDGIPNITFSAKYISAEEALKLATSIANLKYRVDEEGKVSILPWDAPDGEVIARSYDVPSSFIEKIETVRAEMMAGREKGADGFVGMGPGGVDRKSMDMKELFGEMGVKWPRGSKLSYDPETGKVIAENTANNLGIFEEKLELLTEADKKEEEETKARFKAFGVNPFVKTVASAFSTFGIDVDTAAYTLARNYMLKGFLPPAESVRTEEFVNFFDYAYKAPTHRTFNVYTEVAPSKFGRGLHMLKIGVKGKRLGREEQRRAALTFLIDTSGSMNTLDRIGLVKRSLRMLVEKLNPDDLVAIVQYDSRARIVLDHTKASELRKILEAIDDLQCGGSTNLEEGMARAYELAARNFVTKGENRVMLLSDGVANLGSVAAEEILNRVSQYRKQGIYCSVVGFGTGTYDDTTLETLANKGDGAYTFIDSEEEAQRVFVDDLSATLNTIASDVKIQVEFRPERVRAYRQLGYENRQLKKEQFRDDTVDAGEVGSGQSVTALYELELAGEDGGSPPTAQRPASNIQDRKEDVLAIVRVRYRRVDNGKVEEMEHYVSASDIACGFEWAGPRFKLAVCVAEFAEILRGSPFAAGSECDDVARVVNPVAGELSLDKRVQELARMVRSAGGMSRGE